MSKGNYVSRDQLVSRVTLNEVAVGLRTPGLATQDYTTHSAIV